MLIKHEIPILEYDDNPTAVIMPNHERFDMQLPPKCVFAFLGECIDEYAQANACTVAGHFESITKRYPVYIVRYQNQDICLCQAPVGSSAATQIMDWLIGYGVKKIISAGSCGVLQSIPENTFLLPTQALRAEGTSYHYLPPARYAQPHPMILQAIEKVLQQKSLPYLHCTTWTTDGFFRETQAMVNYRRQEGCTAVEMECAALCSCAQLRGVQFGQLLYTADSLANAQQYDERGWGHASLHTALQLCLDIAAAM